jgi:hypothetical protein
LDYRVSARPNEAKLRAWDKLEECERRLVFYSWLKEGVDEDPGPSYRPWVDDAFSAFVYALEATIQFGLDEWVQGGRQKREFWAWLQGQSGYTLNIRALRTIRHLAAHVEVRQAKGSIVAVIGHGPKAGQVRRHFFAPEMDEAALEKLVAPAVSAEELATWQNEYSDRSLEVVLGEALESVASIVAALEAELHDSGTDRSGTLDVC